MGAGQSLPILRARQYVEITMMSPYLKALEGERSQLLLKQSLPPELKYNIICGTSLIGRIFTGTCSLGSSVTKKATASTRLMGLV